ncbi:MAG: hypothetical protein GX994_05655 [Firmicutes bacterium]|nr:hypothetical protein [Bacillota bacterium]
MAASGKNNFGMKEKQVLSPIDGGKVDKIQPLLKYAKPFPRPGALAEVFLILKNNTGKRVEGWLTITPPCGWVIEPGRRLMIAIRPQGRILAEFFLSTPEQPAQGPHLLQIRITAKKEALLAEAAFDIRPGLLFLVDG